jgi:hypothetical protein
VRQRVQGWANRFTQASHTAWLGQAWQTAHRLGMRRTMFSNQDHDIGPIYFVGRGAKRRCNHSYAIASHTAPPHHGSFGSSALGPHACGYGERGIALAA